MHRLTNRDRPLRTKVVVDFSLMRLLRNYKGEIPDPIKARPGLNGPQGKLTRLCFWIWEAILQQHQPVLISENVPWS